ncbi:dermonecrotic toxin domain-containing protein [Pseudomonas sp. BJa5]|uniref:leucine-rich repeat domain-containing protein n=1 Tax=Pseudomonas sp. BJa5 TaxID=2936270 RepID=UPI002559A6FF|nr:leucine-rich repeat domain-containing protein [Pseudomonas sp. BGr12]MDL2421647.1 leucine-rich repeat domain-containing protein [Pseudomonas sp. BGr12]
MAPTHPAINFIQARIPTWVARLKRKELAGLLPDSATASEPQWLRSASARMRKELLANQARSHASRHEAAKAFAALQSAYEFCLPKIDAMLKEKFDVTVDCLQAQFVKRVAGFNVSSTSVFEAAMKNFTADEVVALRRDTSSLLSRAASSPAYPDRLPVSAAEFAQACRELDLGRHYQEHLKSVLDSAQDQALLRSKKKTVLRDLLRVDATIARIKGDIDEQGYTLLAALLRQAEVAQAQVPLSPSLPSGHVFTDTRCMRLSLSGVALTQIVIMAPSVTDASAIVPCIVFIPGDPLHPLKQYASLEDFKRDLVNRLAARDFQQFLARFVTLNERPAFLDLLLEPGLYRAQHWQLFNVHRELFDALYTESVRYIKDQARALVRSTLDSDRGDLDTFYNSALAASGLGALVMPAVGVVAFTAVLTAKWLTRYFHAADHWNARVHESGQAFLRAVLLNAAIADGEEEDDLQVPTEMARLIAVRLENGQERLWHPNVLPYAQEVRWKNQLAPNRPDGIYDVESQQWVRINNEIYRIEKDPRLDKWRIVSPRDPALFRPLLEHNGQGAWHHVMEQPHLWSRRTLLRRLGYVTERFDVAQLELLGAISGVTTAQLHEVFRDDAPLPGVLHDTLIRLTADRQVQDLISRARRGALLPGDFTHVAALLVTLPNWPRGKTLELYDSVEYFGSPVEVHGTAIEGVAPLKIARTDQQQDRLFDRIVEVLRAAARPRRDTSDEEDDGDDASARDALCQTVAGGLEQTRRGLFQRFYAQLPTLVAVPVDDEQALANLQRLFPVLPRPVAVQLLQMADARERATWQTIQAPSLQLAQRAEEAGRRVRLSRAFTDFELGYLQNEDTQVLALRLLEQLPGWPGQLRLEVRDLSREGRLLAGIGALSATNHRVLVRVMRGWELYDAGGLRLGTYYNRSYSFFEALFAALPALTLRSLQTWPTSAEALRRSLRDMATGDPERARRLLGMVAASSWLSLRQPDAAGRRVYPGSSLVNRVFGRRTLQQRLEALFVDDTPEQIAVRLQYLVGSATQNEQVVAGLEQRLASFESQLHTWARDTGNESVRRRVRGGTINYVCGPERRMELAQLLGSAWRFQVLNGRTFRLSSGGLRLRIIDRPIASLPPLSDELASVEILELEDLDISSIPESFLRALRNLRELRIRDVALQALPEAIGNLASLQVLELSCPGMRPEALAPLRTARSLTELYINFGEVPSHWTVDHMSVLSAILTLRGLDIVGSAATFEAGAFAGLGQLQRLNLSGNRIALDAGSAGQWQGLTGLQYLNLSDNPLGHAPSLVGMTQLRSVMLEQCDISEWPAGLESLPAVTGASLLYNPIARVPVGAGRVVGLRLSLGNLEAIERQRVIDEMATVHNLQRFSLTFEYRQMELMEGAAPEERWQWEEMLASETPGMYHFARQLYSMASTEVVPGNRSNFLEAVQTLFRLMVANLDFREMVCSYVLRQSETGHNHLEIFHGVMVYAQAHTVDREPGRERSMLMQLTREYGRGVALIRYVEEHIHEWIAPGRVVDFAEVLNGFQSRLARVMTLHLPLFERRPLVELDWINDAMVQAAADAIRSREGRDVVRWALADLHWINYLRNEFAERYDEALAVAQSARDYLTQAFTTAQPAVPSEAVRSLLARVMEVAPTEVQATNIARSRLPAAQRDARLDEWRERLETLLRQDWVDLRRALLEEVFRPAPPA